MQIKKYSSFEEIDNDLAILRLEREIHYKKISLYIQKTKDLFSPESLATNIFRSFAGGYSGIAGTIAGFIVMLLLKKIRNWHKV